jgi:hypothetical protein
MANNDDMLANSKQRFGFDSWPRLSGVAALPLVRHFSFEHGMAGPDWIFEEYRLEGDSEYASYFHKQGSPSERVMLRLTEHPSHEDALLAMLSTLTGFMRLTVPRLDESGIALGNVAFGSGGSDLTHALFVRHNVFVEIRSIGDTPAPVLDPARRIDAQIQAATTS